MVVVVIDDRDLPVRSPEPHVDQPRKTTITFQKMSPQPRASLDQMRDGVTSRNRLLRAGLWLMEENFA